MPFKRSREETALVYEKWLLPFGIQKERVHEEVGVITGVGIFLIFVCVPLLCSICFNNESEFLCLSKTQNYSYILNKQIEE